MAAQPAAAPGPSAPLTPAPMPEKVPPIQEQIKDLMTQTNAFLVKVPIAKNLSDKTGQPPAVLAGAAFLFTCLIILYSHGFDALCNLVGFVYPLYASYKALKTEGKADDTEWLTYWVVFGFFIVVEDFADAVFDRNVWSTMYFVLKLVFIIWCQLPQYKGANWVYNKIVYPVLKKYEKDIDASLHVAEQGAEQAANQAKADIAEQAIQNAAGRQPSKKAM